MYGLPFLVLLIGHAVGYAIAGLVGLQNFRELISFVVGISLCFLSYTYLKSKDWSPERYTPTAAEKIDIA
jgi:hypothetical protein